MNSTSSLLTRLMAVAGCALFAAGCIFDGASQPPAASWVGRNVDSLSEPAQLLVHGGQLLVANRDSSDPGIAVADTGTGLITAYYTEKLPASSMAVAEDRYVVITETDYSEGSISVLDLTGKSLQSSVLTFGSDNFVDTAGGMVYLFDHTTGVITGFTGHAPGQNVVFNLQTGANSNPYDIAVANATAFIPRYNQPSLLLADPAQLGGGALDSLDLSAYDSQTPPDSAAGTPRMAFATAYNGYVFVALQRLNYNYAARDTSLVVVIDAASKQVVSTIPLQFKNPVSAHVEGTMWYLACAANYAGNDGGVEKIDLNQRVDAGVVVSAQTLGGNVTDFVPAGEHAGFAVVAAYSGNLFVTRVKRVAF